MLFCRNKQHDSLLKVTTFCTIVAIILSTILPANALASPPKFWKESAYAIECKNTPLSVVLRDFAKSFSVDPVIDASVSGNCDGWRRSENAIFFLDNIATEFKFQWFVYKTKIYFSSVSDQHTKRLKLSDGLKKALIGVGVFQKKFGWGELPGEKAVLVSGPKRYIDMIERLGKKQKDKTTKKSTEKNENVYVFPLKYASVMDRTITIRRKKTVIPGVATILKGLLVRSGSTPNPKLTGIGADVDSSKTENFLTMGRGVKKGASVEADVRTNSVIIKSATKDFDYYQELIDELDQVRNLIEIDAIIVDISREKLKDIGVNLDYSNTRTGENGGFRTFDRLQANPLNPVANVNATVLINDLNQFQANLKLMQGRGDASIIANTSILTMENEPAVIDLSETVFIQNIAERVATVEPVTAGTLLNVTPKSIDDIDSPKIGLAVEIEDGKVIQNVQSNGLPSIRKTNISTRAIIDQSRSLVIGGYHVNSTEDTVNKVPGVGDVPILGHLFSSRKKKVLNRERLFILTPRISETSHNPADFSSTGSANLIADQVQQIQNRWLNANRSYVEKTLALFKLLAVQKMPYGYMKKYKKESALPFKCLQKGIEFDFSRIGYHVDGHGIRAYIGSVTNRSDEAVTVKENSCIGAGLIGVSLYPKKALAPGESTTMFSALEYARMNESNKVALDMVNDR
ncbi:type III secretion system outer membrane ring subunit SctC [Agarilytica rhodophyticola]|uniref:type III secretion system outer membrane ring subunit SctC n=1 Tax=Agarilytica rhodophyticola TaxID=1737490 RepID=UPI000B34302E|nr:type III secretion system outer membrane ring subunit SctC [Agarilytica rhodophyticola]